MLHGVDPSLDRANHQQATGCHHAPGHRAKRSATGSWTLPDHAESPALSVRWPVAGSRHPLW